MGLIHFTHSSIAKPPKMLKNFSIVHCRSFSREDNGHFFTHFMSQHLRQSWFLVFTKSTKWHFQILIAFILSSITLWYLLVASAFFLCSDCDLSPSYISISKSYTTLIKLFPELPYLFLMQLSIASLKYCTNLC